MATLYDAPAADLIEAVADKLEDRIDEPAWAELVTAGTANELPPVQDDFWYVRAASLLRKVATNEPVGVERLTTEYGGSKEGTNRWKVASNRRADGSGKIIRTILQQLEEEDLVMTADGEGRRITADGRSLLDTTAGEVIEDLDRPDLERYA